VHLVVFCALFNPSHSLSLYSCSAAAGCSLKKQDGTSARSAGGEKPLTATDPLVKYSKNGAWQELEAAIHDARPSAEGRAAYVNRIDHNGSTAYVLRWVACRSAAVLFAVC
jgi:hypothetical protein